MSITVGDQIGDYEVTGTLGVGGMGQVYRVRHTISHRVEAAAHIARAEIDRDRALLAPDKAVNRLDIDRRALDDRIEGGLVSPLHERVHVEVLDLTDALF